MDDVPMLRASCGAGMLCVPRPSAADDRWTGEAEGKQRLAALADAEGFWLHEATAGPREYRELEAEMRSVE
eukprot:3904288-Prymnesium_polylepis.1